MRMILIFLIWCLSAGLLFPQGASLPYSSGFDSAAEKLGWQQYRTGFLSTYSWSYSGGAFSAPTCVSHDYHVGGNSADTVVDWFVSPALNFATTATMSLKVKTGGFSTPFPDNFEILFGTDSQDPANGNFVVIANLSYMMPQYVWLDTTLSIPLVSDSGYIALKYKTIGAAWSTYAFDNISIVADPASISENAKEQNAFRSFPNPFTSETTLKMEKMLLDATLTVYNAQGEQVRQADRISGQSLSFHRENLAAGMYFLVLREDSRPVASGKLLVTD